MSEVVFFNVWKTESLQAQEALLSKMRLEAPALASKPGFLRLKAWAGQNDHRVIVEARWASEAEFRAAVVDNPEARSARGQLEFLGKSEPGIFVESFQQGSRPVEIGPAGESGERTRALRHEATRRWRELGFEAGMISLGDIEVYVATGGRGKPVLLLHGYPQSGEIWRFVAPELAKTRRVIIPDLRGMGLSDIAPAGDGLPGISQRCS